MNDPRPRRQQSDLAEMLEMLLDKGVVINADIAVSIGDTELLDVKIRAAVASFETAAKYGLEFPTGTDMKRVEAAAGVDELDDPEGEQIELNELGLESANSDDGDEESGEEEERAEETATAEAEGAGDDED